MSAILPLAAIRYATGSGNNLSSRIAPPYDVIDAREKSALLARDDRNFVSLDLPHVPAKDAGPPQLYAAVAQRIRDWLADGTLTRDATPAIYPYVQRYQHDGREIVRRKFFARLRLEPFGAGSVFPHERTFGGPKEDRLALMQTTHCNLSPIFGLYEDRSNDIAGRLAAAIAGQTPLLRGTQDGVDNQVWAVTDAAVIGEVMRRMCDKPTYIADGHHRYGTALMYRERIAAQRGELPHEHPANYVLCVFCAMEDPGLLILPTHRVLPGTKLSAKELSSDAALEVAPLKAETPQQAVEALAALGPQALALYDSVAQAFASVRPRDAAILDRIHADRSLAWRRLGLAFLHAYLLDRVVTPRAGHEPEIHYVKSAAAAVDEARQSGGCALLVQPTTMTELRDVCSAADLMPQKSTYFFPKLASGLIVNPLT